MSIEKLQQAPGKTGSENDGSSEPITTPEEVPESNDEKIDQDFPGYPHYPANDDILHEDNQVERVDVDIDNLTTGGKNVNAELKEINSIGSDDPINASSGNALQEDDDDLEIVAGTEADVTAEDLILLGDKDHDTDMGEDEEIKRAGSLLDQTGDELDIPGSELDDANEMIGEEDEENNYYSIGGDNHDNLEESGSN